LGITRTKEEIMTTFDNRVVALAITSRQTRIWAVNDAPGTSPELIEAFESEDRANHYKNAPRDKNWTSEKDVHEYFDRIAQALGSPSEVLLLGHGHGKANSMNAFVHYIERKHPDLHGKIVGALNTHLESMTNGEIAAAARKWFTEPIHAR
jgi:hypothetical protein